MAVSGAMQGVGPGAKWGAALGSLIPIPGVGTAIGAGLGAIGGGIAGALGTKDPMKKKRQEALAGMLDKWKSGSLGMSDSEYRTKLAAAKRPGTGEAKRATMGGSGPWEGRKAQALMQQLEVAGEQEAATMAQLNQLDEAKRQQDMAQMQALSQLEQAESAAERAAIMEGMEGLSSTTGQLVGAIQRQKDLTSEAGDYNIDVAESMSPLFKT